MCQYLRIKIFMVRDFILYLWQLPQHLLGLLLILLYRAKKKGEYYSAKRFFNSGISLGRYIILQEDCAYSDTIKHETGHSIQSKYFGPLYLLVVGLPSIARNIWDRIGHKKWDYNKRYRWYYSAWPEKQADKLGGVVRF